MADSDQECIWLRRLLGRAIESVSQSQGLESLVYRWFNGGRENRVTSAAILGYRHEGLSPERPGMLLRADPVYLQVDISNALLSDQSVVAVERQEARALIETLNMHFRDDAIEFEMADPDRWYCHFPGALSVETTPISQAVGRDVALVRPTGNDSRRWRSCLAEIEMLLHEHPVNTRRAESGKVPINSVWLWGEGAPEALPIEQPWRVYSDHFYTQSVVAQAGAAALPLDQFCPSNEATLVVDDRLRLASAIGDQPLFAKTLTQLDTLLFQSLWHGLNRKAWHKVVLWGGGSKWLSVDLASRRAFWRRPKPLHLLTGNTDDATAPDGDRP